MAVFSFNEANELKLNRQNTASNHLTESLAKEGVLENYQIGKPIGQGAYATVYVCYHKATMKKYAIKIYQKVKLNDSMKRKAVQREIMALKRIDHPHIIKMYDLIETGK
jgi:serine/threonine protein kinase